VKRATQTITTAHPLPTGQRISIDGEDLLWVVATEGSGPYMSTVRRTPRLRMRVRGAWLRLTRPYRTWRDGRCYGPYEEHDTFCWRRATRDMRCDQHYLKAIEAGEEVW
jgi:hypothetical protein